MAGVEPPNDGNLNGFRHTGQLKNAYPVFVLDLYTNVTQFIQSYGWFLLFGIVVIFFAKRRLGQYFASRPRRPSENLHRYDSELALKRQEAFEISRRQLQEKHDADAARFAEEQKQKEEEKRRHKIEDWDNHMKGKGYRSKFKPSEETSSPSSSSASGTSSGKANQKKKSVYRTSDFNPLTGSGSGGGSYRPPARSGGGGGG